MKTIKQIADEIGVSKQAIAKKVATLPPTEVTTKNDGTKLISAVGERLLKNSTANQTANVGANQTANVGANQTANVGANQTANQPQANSVANELVDMLKNELNIKNEQIRDLNNRLAETTAALQTSQMLHADTKKLLPRRKLHALETATTDSPPIGAERGFFMRIFSTKK